MKNSLKLMIFVVTTSGVIPTILLSTHNILRVKEMRDASL